MEPERLILEDQASNTAENFACSKPLLEEAGVDPARDTVAVVTNDFHMARVGADRRPAGLWRRGRRPGAAALGPSGRSTTTCGRPLPW